MDRGVWQAAVHGVARSGIGLKQLSTHTVSTLNFSRVEITCVLRRDAKGNYEAESIIPLVCFGKAQVSSTLWRWCLPQRGLKRQCPGCQEGHWRGLKQGVFAVVPVVKNPPADAGDTGDVGPIPGWGRFPWRGKWQPTPVLLPGESHRQRSLANYSPWGCKESDTTE